MSCRYFLPPSTNARRTRHGNQLNQHIRVVRRGIASSALHCHSLDAHESAGNLPCCIHRDHVNALHRGQEKSTCLRFCPIDAKGKKMVHREGSGHSSTSRPGLAERVWTQMRCMNVFTNIIDRHAHWFPVGGNSHSPCPQSLPTDFRKPNSAVWTPASVNWSYSSSAALSGCASPGGAEAEE